MDSVDTAADPPQKRQSPWMAALVITMITAVTLFIGIEVGLRLVYRLIPIEVCAQDYLIATYTCQPYFEYDKPVRIGYRYTPGYRVEGMWDPANPFLADALESTAPTERNDAFWYVFETDEMGFPNTPYEWQDQYDIVITGDSFTVRTAPVTWIERLEEKTGEQILTLGAPSWSTLNEAEAVRQFGLDKQPKWVILMFFEGNDLINTGQYLERRDSGLNWKEYDMQGVSWTRRLLTPHLLRYFWGKIRPLPETTPDPANYRYPVTAATEAGEIETVLKDVHLLPLSADYDTLARSDEFEAISQTLLALDAEVKAQNGRFLFVYIPSKEHILWSRIWDEVDVNNILARTVTVTLSEGENGRLQYEPQYRSYDFFNQHHGDQARLIMDFVAENGIEHLNLAPIFWETSIQEGELFHFADPHWNQAGNDLAADAIFDYLESHK